MSQKTYKSLLDEIYSRGPKKNYATNKTDVYHIDDIWKLDILNLKYFGPENNKGYRYSLVIIDNFSKFGWTVPLKNKNAQTVTNVSKIILITSKRKPNLIEGDGGNEVFNSTFQSFFNNNKIKKYSRNTSFGAVFAERFNGRI